MSQQHFAISKASEALVYKQGHSSRQEQACYQGMALTCCASSRGQPKVLLLCTVQIWSGDIPPSPHPKKKKRTPILPCSQFMLLHPPSSSAISP